MKGMVNIKRPIVTLAIGYIIGIIMGLYFNFSIALFYLIGFAISGTLLCVSIHTKPKVKKFRLISFKRYSRYIKLVLNHKVIKVIIITSIISNTIILIQNRKYDNSYQEGDISGKAIVVSNKQEKEYKNQYKIKIEDKYLYIKINKNQSLEYGDKIEFSGKFYLPSTARNSGGFDYKNYLKTLKIYGTVDIDNLKVIGKNGANPILNLANKTYLIIEKQMSLYLEKEKAEILKGILLGDTSAIGEEIKVNFRNANISHILAVSRTACFLYNHRNFYSI